MSIQVLMEHKSCKLQKITAPHLATVSAAGDSVISLGDDLVATTCNLVLVTLWMFVSCREKVYSIRFWHILMTKYIASCICGVIKQNLTIITIGTDLRSGMPIYMKVFHIAYGELSHIGCCHIGFECGLDMSDLSIFLLRFGDHAVCSVNKCSYNRPLVLEMVVRVKVQILVSVCGFSVYCEIQRAIIIEGGTWVQERQLAFHFRFGGELYVLINAVEVFRELVDNVLMDLHEGVVNISQPHRWGFGAVRMALASNSSMYRLAIIGANIFLRYWNTIHHVIRQGD